MFRSMLGTSLLAPMFETPGESGGGGNPVNPPKPDDNKWVPTAEQQAEINRIAAAERRDAEEKTRAKFEADLAEKKRKEDEQRERDEATKRGEFEKVQNQLETKANEAEAKVKELDNTNKFLRAFVDKTLEREIAELPDVIKAFDPGETADIQVRLDWLEKARDQADKFESENGTREFAGARPPRKPATPGNPSPSEIRQQVRRSMRGRTI